MADETEDKTTEEKPQEKAGDQADKSGDDNPTSAAYWRRKAEQAEKTAAKHQKALDDAKKAQMTEAERDRAERDEYKSKFEASERARGEERLRARVESAAARAGAADPEDVWALIDRGAVSIDDDGKLVGADRAIEALKKSKPYLFGQQAAKGVGSGGGRTQQGESESPNQHMNNWIRQAASR